MSSTMGGGFHQQNQNTENRIGMGFNSQMNQSSGIGGSAEGGQGATNQDLNERLAAMKAKF